MSWRDAAILLFLAVQLGLPLSYYASSDRYDERFAWRMFSSQRMVRCSVAFRDPNPVALGGEIAAPWVTWMKRGHRRVVLAFADQRCAEGGELYVDMVCVLPDGRVDHPLAPDQDLCR